MIIEKDLSEIQKLRIKNKINKLDIKNLNDIVTFINNIKEEEIPDLIKGEDIFKKRILNTKNIKQKTYNLFSEEKLDYNEIERFQFCIERSTDEVITENNFRFELRFLTPTGEFYFDLEEENFAYEDKFELSYRVNKGYYFSVKNLLKIFCNDLLLVFIKNNVLFDAGDEFLNFESIKDINLGSLGYITAQTYY